MRSVRSVRSAPMPATGGARGATVWRGCSLPVAENFRLIVGAGAVTAFWFQPGGLHDVSGRWFHKHKESSGSRLAAACSPEYAVKLKGARGPVREHGVLQKGGRPNADSMHMAWLHGVLALVIRQ